MKCSNPKCKSWKVVMDDGDALCMECGHRTYLDENGHPVVYEMEYYQWGSNIVQRFERKYPSQIQK
jgi:hypothetical protein